MKKAEIYCDESCPDFFTSSNPDGKYLLIGGIKILDTSREEIKNEIKNLKVKYKISDEFKWKKASKNKLAFYKELTDLFFKFNDLLRFKCIVVDVKAVNFEKFHEDDKELGFYKFYYYMLNYWLESNVAYSIFTDLKTNRIKHRLSHLKQCLTYSNIDATIEKVQALPSHEVILLQLSDYLVGLVSAKFNDSLKSTSSKKILLDYFEQKLGHEIKPTPRTEQKFNIFKIDLGRDKW
ncbi:DUF3800 domain-containing protein [Patescibacteria group bacterium]|nr:DUF3800 domain-containing protein [Patescibacteria group bacterium]